MLYTYQKYLVSAYCMGLCTQIIMFYILSSYDKSLKFEMTYAFLYLIFAMTQFALFFKVLGKMD